MQTQYRVLSYRIDLYFHDYKLAIAIDETGYFNKKFDCEIKRQKSIEQERVCKFGPENEDFYIIKAINEIFRHIKESSN